MASAALNALIVGVAVALAAAGASRAQSTEPEPAAIDVPRGEIVRSLTRLPAGDDVGMSRSFRARGETRALLIEDARPNIDLDIRFEKDSADLSPDAESQIEELAAALADPLISGDRIEIKGHTDATGSDEYNLDLSIRRAEAVRALLTDAYRVDPARLDIAGMGEFMLKNPSDPESGVNRRVEIVNLGTTDQQAKGTQ